MRILDLTNLSISQSKLLNDISLDIVSDYHTLVEAIYRKSDTSIDWLVNSLLSRNNRLSHIFIDICYLELVKRIVAKEDIDKVICKTSDQKEILRRFFRVLSRKIEIISAEQKYHTLKRLTKPIRDFASNLVLSWRYIRKRSRERRNMIPKDKGIIIVDTFFIPSMFEKGLFDDRYYQGLVDQLPEDIRKLLYFVPTIPLKTNLKQSLTFANKANENFIYKFDFLKLRDYVFALLSPFRLTLKKIALNCLTFRNFDIGPILRGEFKRNLANTSSFLGILNHIFFKRIQEEGIKLRLVINWFENQVIDRGFNKGRKDFYPKTPSIGYQGFIIPYDFNQHVVPTSLEVETGQIPETIAVVGRGLIPHVQKYYPRVSVVTAPAFRFSEIYNNHRSQRKQPGEIFTVLLALPISIIESIDIIHLALDACRLEALISIRWFIKPHPSLNLRKLMASVCDWPVPLEIVQGSFSDCIEKVDLLVGNASSTPMEALAYGIPVIIAGSRNGITQNPIPGSVPKTMWEVCYTGEEFNRALQRLLLDVDDAFRKIQAKLVEQIRKDYFEPVTQQSILSFLNYI